MRISGTLDANSAFALLLAGLCLVYWELCRPGTILPGALGCTAVLVGGVALRELGWEAVRARVRWEIAGPVLAAFAILTAVLAYGAMRGYLDKRTL